MKSSIFYYLLNFCFFLFISCSNEDNPSPKRTLASNEHMSALIQSEIYEDTASCILFQSDNIIRVTSSSHYPKRITLICDGTITGSYVCSSNTTSSITYYDENGIKFISSGTNPESKITLTNVDLSNNLVSGTFEATLTKENGSETVYITGASFTNLICHSKP